MLPISFGNNKIHIFDKSKSELNQYTRGYMETTFCGRSSVDVGDFPFNFYEDYIKERELEQNLVYCKKCLWALQKKRKEAMRNG